MNPQDPNAPYQDPQPYQGQPYGQQPPAGYPQQPYGAYPQQPYPAAQQPPAKKRSIPPWLVLAVIAIGIGSRFLGGGSAAPMTCDAGPVREEVLKLVNQGFAERNIQVKATGMSAIQDLGKAGDVDHCGATLAFSDGESLRVNYDLQGSNVHVLPTAPSGGGGQPGAGAAPGGYPGGSVPSASGNFKRQ